MNQNQQKTFQVAKPDQHRNVSVRRAEFSSEQPLSELLRRTRKEEPLRELLSTRQRSDDVFRSELLETRKDSTKNSRRAEPLPSASDYSDLESPERETGWSALQAYLREAIPRKNFVRDKGALLSIDIKCVEGRWLHLPLCQTRKSSKEILCL